MKILSILLFSCIFLMPGCYVESSITKDEPVADEGTVLFYLTDGSYIKSNPGKHPRLEQGGGYGVTGFRVKNNQSKDKFEGVVQDAQIERVAVEQFSWPGTAFMAVGASLVAAIAVFVASGSSLPH